MALSTYPAIFDMQLIGVCIGTGVAFGLVLFWRRYLASKANTIDNVNRLDTPNSIRHCHPLTQTFTALVDVDGAGTWPPRADHESWQSPLGPHKEIYQELLPHLSTEEPCHATTLTASSESFTDLKCANS